MVRIQLDRRGLLCAAVVALPPLRTPAAGGPAVPTFSLKGVPGVSSLLGADVPRPTDQLGILGRGKDGVKSGRLNFCEKKGCVSTFSLPDDKLGSYIPPWTYSAEEVGAISSFSSSKARSNAAAERKTIDEAQAELKKVVEAAEGSTIVKEEPRYIYAEFTDPVTGVVDDVEFLFSSDSPIVGYRSAPRAGSDDKRQRERIRALRKSLPSGWKSVGRMIE